MTQTPTTLAAARLADVEHEPEDVIALADLIADVVQTFVDTELPDRRARRAKELP